MLSHLGALAMLRLAQPACGSLVPAAQQVLGHVHFAGFATKTKTSSPPYLNDIKKGSAKKSRAEEKEKVPRALNAYAWYVKEHASAHKGKASSAAGLMNLIAQDWKGLSDQQKQPYNDLAAKSKAEAAAARGELKASKGPPSAYNIWHQEVFRDVKASNPSMKATDITKEVAARWNALPQDEKDRRSAAAKAARAQAAVAKGKVKASKGPPNAYSMWRREVYSDVKASNPSMKAADLFKEVAARWNALPQDEKDRRSAAAKAAKEAWQAQQPVVVQ